MFKVYFFPPQMAEIIDTCTMVALGVAVYNSHVLGILAIFLIQNEGIFSFKFHEYSI